MFTPDKVQFEDRNGTIIIWPISCKYQSMTVNSANESGGTTQTNNCKVMVNDLLSWVSEWKYMTISNNGRALWDYIIDKIEPKYRKNWFHHNLVYWKLAE